MTGPQRPGTHRTTTLANPNASGSVCFVGEPGAGKSAAVKSMAWAKIAGRRQSLAIEESGSERVLIATALQGQIRPMTCGLWAAEPTNAAVAAVERETSDD